MNRYDLPGELLIRTLARLRALKAAAQSLFDLFYDNGRQHLIRRRAAGNSQRE